MSASSHGRVVAIINNSSHRHFQTRSHYGILFSYSLLINLVLTILFIGSTGVEARRRSSISSLITENLYNSIFLHKDDNACLARNFYTYNSFIQAASCFPKFGNTGDIATRRRKIAAFLAQISQETTGRWATAPDGPFAWGLCFKEEINPQSNYCDATNTRWPCFPGKSYHGRGPIQLSSWNYNYGQAGRAVGFDGLRNPEIVANNSLIAYKTAFWFWMTVQTPKPSCHGVMVGKYVPTEAYLAANRTA
ncbi:Chitinase 10 [Hibiscus syriacus]|uniref:Chitinase 10 n=1 Tax=Hibiscus syriacus TaxID=106335 RepID=A0A6A3A5Q1_HIBSY|nr:Chitinase 10 [Hibiscus syriacus]